MLHNCLEWSSLQQDISCVDFKSRNYTPQDLGYAHLLQAGESNGPTGSSSASANVHHAAAGDFLTLHHHQQQQQTSSQQQQTHLQQLQPASLHHHHQQQQQQQQQQHHHSLQPIVSSAPAGVTFKHHHQIGASDGNGTRSAAVTAVASANVQQQATVNSMAPQAYAPAQPQHSSAVGATGPQPMQYYDLNNMTESCSTSLYMGGSNAGSSSSMKVHHQVDSSTLHPTRKRKGSYNEGSDFEDDTGDDSKSVRTNDDCRKQNHSEIEKRRRDKMNTYIMELSSMVPMCHAMSRKLDKLTVLRMAVQHLKTIRGAVNSYTEGHYKPAFLSDQELKTLILQAAEGFLFVVGCDRGRILYVSESVSQVLNYSQGDLLGQSWFDILHPKDVAKVKEQLSSSDLSPRERLIDAKTMLPVKTDLPQGVSRLCPGARRSFFCRMKCKLSTQIKEEADTTTGCHRRKKQPNSDKKYSVIQCTGYLKSWAPAKIGLDEQEGEGDGEACNLSCLVAVGRLQPQISLLQTGVSTRMPNVRTIQFISRHAMDGKFLFVDQRATLVLGFLPQELLGTSMYEYYHHEDIPALAESHKCALQGPEWVTTDVYRFRSKEGSFVKLQSDWKSFRNPWTKDVEYLIAKNSVILSDSRTVESSATRTEGTNHIQGNFDFFSQSNGRDIQRLINSHVEASKIGRQIAEQVIDSQRRSGDSSLESSPDPDVEHVIPLTTAESLISTSAPAERQRLISVSSRVQNGLSPSGYPHVINNVVLPNDPESEEEIIKMMGGGVIPESTDPVGVPSDGNDEAAMAVIMSLLEADAGLGGPVDFSGLPWPLP